MTCRSAILFDAYQHAAPLCFADVVSICHCRLVNLIRVQAGGRKLPVLPNLMPLSLPRYSARDLSGKNISVNHPQNHTSNCWCDDKGSEKAYRSSTFCSVTKYVASVGGEPLLPYTPAQANASSVALVN